MRYADAKSLKELDDEKLFDALCRGINNPDHVSHLKELFEDTVRKHYILFEDKIFTKKRFKSENNPEGHHLLEYILPTVRRAYSKFFIDVPGIFKSLPNQKSDVRLELFQLQFNLEEFLKNLSEKFKKNVNCLKDFEYLDTNSEILTLIVENYVSSKLNFTLDKPMNEIQSDIREIKLNNHLGV